ncbi:MAG: NADH-quinone oxidoreductase subunit NuoK [Chloroflexi bacterium]|nr:NADH-quinone oxidoreductase subunit NuoK [Chloroflexota bacterium]MDA8188335.1 NADH-quinone oxidoreductase subunit NuoK [Dehalococcoidales bacterium]
MLSLNHFLLLGAVLFSIGLYGALSRRNAVAILMCIELMFNAVNITLVAFARFLAPAATASQSLAPVSTVGQVFTIFVITVAAAEAAVGLAIVLAIYRTRRTISVEDVDLMKW